MYDTTHANVAVPEPVWAEFKESLPADWNLDRGVTVATAFYALEERGDEIPAERRKLLEELVGDD